MATSSKLANRRVADLCVSIETTMAEIYRAFARIHAGDAAIAALFEKTAREEDSHASHFRVTPGFFDSIVVESTVDAARAAALLGECRTLLETLASTTPTVVESLEAAIELEGTFVEFHMETAFLFTNEGHRRMFHAMMEADRAHVESLTRALEDLKT